MKEKVAKKLKEILIRKNAGLLDDEAHRQAYRVMEYYEEIKQAEMEVANEE